MSIRVTVFNSYPDDPCLDRVVGSVEEGVQLVVLTFNRDTCSGDDLRKRFVRIGDKEALYDPWFQCFMAWHGRGWYHLNDPHHYFNSDRLAVGIVHEQKGTPNE